MTKSKERPEFSKFVSLDYSKFMPKYSITYEASLYKYEDRFSFIRKHFLSPQEEDVANDVHKQLLELQDNDHNLKTLNLPIEEKEFKFELDEDFFEQLYLSLQKIVHSTNEENFGIRILSLLNVLFIWLDLGVLDFHPAFLLFHDHLIVYLYHHLPAFTLNRLKKIKSPQYKLLCRNKI